MTMEEKPILDLHVERKGRWFFKHRILILAIFALVAVLMLVGLAACNENTSGGTSETNKTNEDESGAVSQIITTGNNFLDNSSGLFPDNFFNTTMLNIGNRGCNSCHENLFDTWGLIFPSHIISFVGYTPKNGRISDCLPCHQIHSDRTGVYLGDVIHASHYSNDRFINELNGNCWSCHAMTSIGYSGNGTLHDPGDYQMLLWEQILYEPALGGYPDADWNDATRIFTQGREISKSGFITGVSIDNGDTIKADLSQEVTPEEYVFVVNNFGPQTVDASTWKLTIEGGVNDPKSFTLEDLKAMKQSSITAAMVCGTGGVGTPFFGNIPVSGVLLSDIIDACGGLKDGTNMTWMTAYDSWQMPFCIEDMVNAGALVALNMWDHELTNDQGFPATIVIPGAQGASWVKWIVNITFTADDFSFNPFKMDIGNDQKQQLQLVNSSWLANDGIECKAGETIELEGWSFSPCAVVGRTAKIQFSADMGLTWKSFDVPKDFKPEQLVNWSFKWTPSEPGVYVLKVRAEASDGRIQTGGPDNVIVVVK